MDKRRSVVVAVALLAVLGCAFGARAEVSAELDSQGNYVGMYILSNSSVKNLKIWTAKRGVTNYVPLNPDGDPNGDLWPYHVENPLEYNHPMVVWSRFNGVDYDLAWSRWRFDAWSPISWLESAPYELGDDLDPHLIIDEADGRPYVAWWRDDGGVGRIYLSLFLDTVWMDAYPVSLEGEDGRYPTVTLQEDGTIRVDYETPLGPVSRIVIFARPHTITDDLNPFDTLSMSDGDGSESLSN
jgi:hypothetical protein